MREIFIEILHMSGTSNQYTNQDHFLLDEYLPKLSFRVRITLLSPSDLALRLQALEVFSLLSLFGS